MRRYRLGKSLVEIIVVIAIIAALMAILLPAIQNARMSSWRASNLNLAKQVLLARQQFSNANHGILPSLTAPDVYSSLHIVYRQIEPFVDTAKSNSQWARFPSDPSPWKVLYEHYPSTRPDGTPIKDIPEQPLASIVWNSAVIHTVKHSSILTDGASSTIEITEKYGVCNKVKSNMYLSFLSCGTLDEKGKDVFYPCSLTGWNKSRERRPSFADYPMFADVYPITATAADGRRVTTGSVPGKTFQVRPSLSDCDPTIPQSSLPGGIITGFFDGSVRFLNPNTSPEVYWSLVTPAGGEAVSVE